MNKSTLLVCGKEHTIKSLRAIFPFPFYIMSPATVVFLYSLISPENRRKIICYIKIASTKESEKSYCYSVLYIYQKSPLINLVYQ